MAKGRAYDNLYARLETKEGEKELLYRLARQRDSTLVHGTVPRYFFSTITGTVGTWYQVPVPRYFFYKVPRYPSNSRVIESFLQVLRHVFIFCIDCSFKVVP